MIEQFSVYTLGYILAAILGLAMILIIVKWSSKSKKEDEQVVFNIINEKQNKVIQTPSTKDLFALLVDENVVALGGYTWLQQLKNGYGKGELKVVTDMVAHRDCSVSLMGAKVASTNPIFKIYLEGVDQPLDLI